MDEIKHIIEYVGKGTEIAGILIIVFGIAFALVKYFMHYKEAPEAYKIVRQEIGRAILLGLEILVAADIILTVVADIEMNRVLTLGLIILIRTFLSFSIEVEIEGKFPWQQKK